MSINIKYITYKILYNVLPPILVYRFIHFKNHLFQGGEIYWMQLKEPRTFNEIITWLKLYDRPHNATDLVDKIKVKSIVSGLIGESYVVDTLMVGKNARELDFNALPEQCVIKPNHGSGWIYFLDKSKPYNKKLIKKKISSWLNMNAYYITGEWQYKKVSKRVLVEPFIDDFKSIKDYKFYCVEGVPKFILVISDRHKNKAKWDLMDIEWNKLSVIWDKTKHDANRVPDIPKNFKKMLDIVEVLSKNISFVRVDLYNNEGKIYFGELTFHPGSGNVPFDNYEDDLRLGQMLDFKTSRHAKI